jgi:ribosomal-protein-alanine N-acetyltransferase
MTKTSSISCISNALKEILIGFIVQLQASGVKEVFIEVRTSNHSALSFYKKLRFEAINTRKKYYSDGEDAIILRFITRLWVNFALFQGIL